MLQTLCIFFGGYLASRLVIRAEAQRLLVAWLVRRVQTVSLTVLGLILGSAILSSFLPNTLTVIALLPVVTELRRRRSNCKHFASLLALSLIYGSNMGGMFSLIGTPANLYLLVTLRFYGVAGWETLSFLNWIAFGIPMTLSLVLLTWVQVRLTESQPMRQPLSCDEFTIDSNPRLKPTMRFVWLWLSFWLLLLTLQRLTALDAALWGFDLFGEKFTLTIGDLLGLLFTILATFGLFRISVSLGANREPLMALKDVTRELPVKGLIAVAVVLAVVFLLARSGIITHIAQFAPKIVPESIGAFGTNLLLLMITTFSTEVFHNTTVATVLYPVALLVAGQSPINPLFTMLGISLASNCAFMTPVATPVNALVYSGVGGFHLQMMLKNGLITNLIAATWLSIWITWIIPRLIG